MKRLLYFGFCLLLSIACIPQETEVPKFNLTLSDQVTEGYEEASLNCSVSANFTVEKITVEYSTENSLDGAKSYTLTGDGKTFTGMIQGLKMDTKYFYRYTVSNRFNTITNETIRSFTTLNYTGPKVSTLEADAIKGSSAVLHGSLVFSRGENVIERGFKLGTNTDKLEKLLTESEDFSVTAKGLAFDTQYFYRAFVLTEAGLGEGEIKKFTTMDGIIQIRTLETSGVTAQSATVKGNLVSDGGEDIIRMGFLLSEKEQLDSDVKEILVSNTTGTFSTELKDLEPNTTYYVRAFAVNGRDTFHGGTDSFVTAAIPVSSISLNQTEVTLNKGESETLIATVSPENATYKDVTWSSSRETVASVDQTGKVTTLKAGTATIQAKAGEKTATCTVTVIVPPEGITISESSITLEEEQKKMLYATVTPDDTTDPSVTWQSSDNSVATVQNGLVTAIKVGTCIVTAKVGGLSASCDVTVKEKTISVTGVKLNKRNTEIIKGESETLVATVSPENATDKTVTWSSKDESIATVDQNGKVTAIKGGETTIYAKAGDYSDYCYVKVKVPVSSIKLDYTSMRVGIGYYNRVQLHATIEPDDASDKTVTWSSSDASIAEVYSSGTVEGKSKGNVTITATAGDCSASCEVEVIRALSSVSLTCQHEGYNSYYQKLTIKKGENAQFNAVYSPQDADVFDIEWSSSDLSVVTIDDEGLVTAVGAGSAVIKITADGKEASCSVTVLVDTEYITLDQTEVSMDIGQTITLVATLHPEDATDAVSWKSSKEAVVTVDQNGNITAIKAGDAVITVSAGGKTATCNVNVKLVASKYLTFSSEWNVSLGVNYKIENVDLYWSRDKNTWTGWDYTPLRFGPDNELYLCGKNTSLNDLSFTVTGTTPFSCTGDIMSLIDMTQDVTTIPSGSCFYRLFANCTLLQKAPDLTATTLSNKCYYEMFSGCTGLLTPPVIAATKVGVQSCAYMFSGCTNLESAPVLHATKMESSCYEYMFSRCKNLKSAPELPATTLAYQCYYHMFYECESLTTAPELPALTMEEECYQGMFYGCKSLTAAPSLPAMTLAKACYYSMFENCSNLTSAPSLPALTLVEKCYSYMFDDCSSLETAPVIEATTVAKESCSNMFSYCGKLTQGPELKAKLLEERCYSSMFFQCSHLNYIKFLGQDWSPVYCTSNWLYGVSQTGTFVKDASVPEMPRGESGIPKDWTVVDAE